jgi:hypothetical protein
MSRVSAIAAVLLLTAATSAAAGTRFSAATASSLQLEGSSNVADWRCRGTSIDAAMDVAAPLAQINAVIDRVEDGNVGVWMADPAAGRFPQPSFRLRIPVATLRCGNRAMERDMSNALKASAYPAIEFRFKELRGGIRHDLDRNVYETRIAGELALAGMTREIVLDVVAQRIGRDRFRLRARLPLRMTDFGIQPPAALFGMIKARDELLVLLDLVLEAAS